MNPLERTILSFFILPLAGLAVACGPSAYDLRGPALEAGQILQTRTRGGIPSGTLTVELKGRSEVASVKSEHQSVTELEVVEADELGLKTLKRSVPEDWSRRVTKADRFQDDDYEDNPMAGTRVLIERAANGYTQTLLDRQADPAQKRILAQTFEPPSAVYPQHKIKIGESWTVEGPALARLLGEEDALAVSGNATFTLDRVSEVDGERRAFISVRLEATIKSLDEDNQEVEGTFGGSGTIERSIDRGLDLKNQLTGQMRLVSRQTVQNRKSTFTLAGAATLEASERFVSIGERHAVALKGKPARATSPRTVPPRPAPAVVVAPQPAADVVPVAAISPAAKPDNSLRLYSLTAQGASIARWSGNGDGQAMFSGNVPPEASVRIAVDGTLVLASAAPLNTWEPYWGMNATFEARASSTVQIAVLENDIDGSWETIAQWQGTLGELLRNRGKLTFGAVERFSYELSAF